MTRFTRRAIAFLSFLCIVIIILEITNVPESKGTQNGKTDADVRAFWDMDEVTLFNRISCYMYVPLEVDGKVAKRRLERPPAELKARGCQKSLPRVLLIGVKDWGGTTAMGKYLGLHPSISYSYPVQPGPKITNETVEAWKGEFQLTSYKQLSFTGHHSFFADAKPQLIQMVRKYLPDDVKLILMLRDPVQRLVSDYVRTLSIAERLAGDERKQYEDNEGLKGSLEATLLDEMGHVNPSSPIVRQGMYNIDLRTLYQHIRKDIILIIDGNAFRKDPYPSLVEMERFLNLPPFLKRRHFVYDEVKRVHCANVSSRPDVRCVIPLKGKSLPAIDDDLLLKLYKFFQPHNTQLEKNFGVKFPWVYRPPTYIYLD